LRGRVEAGRLELSPRAAAEVEHAQRLAAFLDFINDPIGVRLLAINQIP